MLSIIFRSENPDNLLKLIDYIKDYQGFQSGDLEFDIIKLFII